MKNAFCAVFYSLVFLLALAQHTAADLITDGYFQALTYSGSKTLTTLYGQFGTGTGSTLTLANWTTTGYNFVYAPGTADVGTNAGAASGQPNEAPGQYKTSAGYGNTYMWGSNNSNIGAVTLPLTDPAGGNFIAADGAYEVGAISQTINNLTPGKVYNLNFYWAAAQQQNYTGPTTENWQVSLGGQAYTTPTFSLPSKSFSGWMQQTFSYTATAPSETLSFLAGGTPSGLPPFVLLGGVSMDVAPEPSTWMMFAGFGAACTVFGVVRRRRATCRAGESSC